MTEEQWLACDDPRSMLEFLLDRASDRKVRLFSVASCRNIWACFQSPHSKQLVELVELAADGLANVAELNAVSQRARDFTESEEASLTEVGCSAAYAASRIVESYPGERAVWIASTSADCVANTRYWIAFESEISEERRQQAADAAQYVEEKAQTQLLRCIFGPLPFRAVTIDSAWLRWNDGFIAQMAQHIYDERNFADLPILSDALIDAGCTNQDIIEHCRSNEPHCRGCWVVDLLTGRS